jgi:hypothetical protein
MGRYWHCVLTADHLISICSKIAIIRSRATARTSPRLCSSVNLLIQPTAGRTAFVQLEPLFISRPVSRRGGSGSSRDCRNWLDFGLDNRDIATRFPRRASNFTVFQNTQTGSGADPLSYLRDTGAFSPGVKRPWQQADYSPPYIVNVQKGWMFLHSSHMPSWHGRNFTFWYVSCFFSVATQILYLTHPQSTTS